MGVRVLLHARCGAELTWLQSCRGGFGIGRSVLVAPPRSRTDPAAGPLADPAARAAPARVAVVGGVCVGVALVGAIGDDNKKH